MLTYLFHLCLSPPPSPPSLPLSHSDLYSRTLLDSYLSRALNVELENGRLGVIDDSAYVLTLDYTIKMLNIHERYKCGVPVIIEGETGVGKTALVEMLSKLWNQSLLLEWRKQRSRLLEFFQRKLGDAPIDLVSDNYQVGEGGGRRGREGGVCSLSIVYCEVCEV